MKAIDRYHINNSNFLVIAGSYQHCQVGVYRGTKLCAAHTLSEGRSSANLVLLIKCVLDEAKVSLSDLAFIAVDQGPGAFTSLRVVLATVNGIAFATGIPLVGCDGLEAVIDHLQADAHKHFKQDEDVFFISVLNAYNREVYYSIQKRDSSGGRASVIPNGYLTIDELIVVIKKHTVGKCFIGGNAVTLYADHWKDLGEHVFSVQYNSIPLAVYAQQARVVWGVEKTRYYSLLPLYLKTQLFKKAS